MDLWSEVGLALLLAQRGQDVETLVRAPHAAVGLGEQTGARCVARGCPHASRGDEPLIERVEDVRASASLNLGAGQKDFAVQAVSGQALLTTQCCDRLRGLSGGVVVRAKPMHE